MTSMNKPSGLRKWLRGRSDAADGPTATEPDPIGGRPADGSSTSADPDVTGTQVVTHVEIVELDDASFDTGTEGGATLVDFWAAWCRPCTMFHPIFQHAADTHDGPVRFARCDIEASPRIASMVGIQSIPTVALFDVDGNEVERLSGVPSPRDLDQLIARATELTTGS